MSPHPARQRLYACIRQPDAQIDLAEAALLIALEDQGGPEPADTLGDLERFARAAAPSIHGLEDPHAIVAALNGFLFGELGFRGNTWRYKDPANSYLDRVVATRTGLPITLSLVYLEVGWRLGLPLAGLALPGHFLVQYLGADELIAIDPYNRGRLWNDEERRIQVASYYGSASDSLMAQVCVPPSRRAILVRLLRNLRGVYTEQRAIEHALAAAERICALDPTAWDDLRERGVLRAYAGQHLAALEDLERYAKHTEHIPNFGALKLLAARLIEEAAAHN